MPADKNDEGEYLALKPDTYSLDHRVLDVTPIAAEVMIKSAELQYTRPAEEATKQEIERTKQTATKARYETVRAAFVPILVAALVWAACKYPDARIVIGFIVGLYLLPSIIGKIKKPSE